LPNKYLILGKTGSAVFPEVLDGQPVADDFDWSDGTAAFNVLHYDGKNTYVVSDLEGETTYDFVIYPYNNSGSKIDYKTDGVIPSASGTTKKIEKLTIADIQKTPDGKEGDSPLAGQVVTVEGVVTGVSSYSYFIQDTAAAWSGINVYDPTNTSVLKLGNRISVTGTVAEYNSKTEIKDVSSMTVLEESAPLPKPLSIKTGELAQEKYEGVLVKVSNATCTNPDLGYGEWEVDDGSGPARIDDLMLKDFTPVQGQTYNITGVCDYSYDNYKIEPRTMDDIRLVTTAPVIEFIGSSVLVPAADQDFVDTVKVTDNGTVVEVQLRYQVNNGDVQHVAMTQAGSDSVYAGVIPSSAYTDGDKVEYWVYAKDNDGEESESGISGFFAGLTPIGTLKQIDSEGSLTVDGYFARTGGVATVSNGVFDAKHLSVYIQDENFSGINVFKYNAADFPVIEGHSYTVTGMLTQYNGLVEIVPEDTATGIIDNGEATMPEPLEVTLAAILSSPEALEGLLLKIVNLDTVAGTAAWPDSGYNANLTVTDDDGASQLTLRIDKDTDLDESDPPSWPQDVVGILSQYDSKPPYLDGYQILPRSAKDLSGLTGLPNSQKGIIPQRVTLLPAFPNPFNPSTSLRFEIPAKIANNKTVSLAIYNILGQKVKTLIAGKKLNAGKHRVKWSGLNDRGATVPSGVYFALLKISNQIWSQKLILLK